MTESSTVLVELLARKWTVLDPILRDNLAQTDGEPLPHLILSDDSEAMNESLFMRS